MPLRNRLSLFLASAPGKETDPAEAYDIWSLSYDEQPDNLVLVLDEELIREFFDSTDLESKIIADVGCGTGRHWQKIMDKNPRRLLGYDVSAGMLRKLKQKFPHAETHILTGNELAGLQLASCDYIISTLTLAHIPNMEEAFRVWAKVLRPGGEIFLTDFHPVALARGAKRTFRHKGKLLWIRNYAYTIEKLKAIARQLHLEVLRFEEREINDTVRAYYERQNALSIFEKFYGLPVIYGMHLKKTNAVT